MQYRPHSHVHTHADGIRHAHGHSHGDYDHDHEHNIRPLAVLADGSKPLIARAKIDSVRFRNSAYVARRRKA